MAEESSGGGGWQGQCGNPIVEIEERWFRDGGGAKKGREVFCCFIVVGYINTLSNFYRWITRCIMRHTLQDALGMTPY